MPKQYELKNFLDKNWCHDNFGICYPILKEVDMAIPISKQKGYNNKYGRYWTKPILKISDKYYIICSQWYEEFREKLNTWIDNNSNTNNSNIKMEVYVLPNPQTKICSKCGNKTEKEILTVTYHTNIENINNKLFTRRCNDCNISYISDAIFKSYTRNKNINNINVKFIELKK